MIAPRAFVTDEEAHRATADAVMLARSIRFLLNFIVVSYVGTKVISVRTPKNIIPRGSFARMSYCVQRRLYIISKGKVFVKASFEKCWKKSGGAGGRHRF